MTRILLLLTLAMTLPAEVHPLEFREHTVATGLKGGYQVVPCDVNHDGKIDLIALSSGLTDLVWYENPNWEPHVIAHNLPRLINLAAWDTDGDGIPEIVVAYEFSMQAKESAGIVAVLKHHGDPRGLWTIQEIDRLPASHRLRWADIDGSGKKVLINAPLTGATAEAPDYREHVPLVYYRPGEWKRRLIDDTNEGVQHGITIVDWDGDGRDQTNWAQLATGSEPRSPRATPRLGRRAVRATQRWVRRDRRGSSRRSNPGTAIESRSTARAPRAGHAR
jgi:hypothetical protein